MVVEDNSIFIRESIHPTTFLSDTSAVVDAAKKIKRSQFYKLNTTISSICCPEG